MSSIYIPVIYVSMYLSVIYLLFMSCSIIYLLSVYLSIHPSIHISPNLPLISGILSKQGVFLKFLIIWVLSLLQLP